jgi:hypothetical protein
MTQTEAVWVLQVLGSTCGSGMTETWLDEVALWRANGTRTLRAIRMTDIHTYEENRPPLSVAES